MTWHADGLEQAAYIALKETPNAASALAAAWEAIHDPSAPYAKIVPIVGQIDRRAGWSIGQVWALALTLDGIDRGDILMRRLPVGETPHADRQRAENAAVLARLPEPWSASVDLEQYGGDQDGWLEWTQPRAFLRAPRQDQPGGAWCAIDPDAAPLEIGSTNASRTWVHLTQYDAVARWPYGDDHVTVLSWLEQAPAQEWPIPEGASPTAYMRQLHEDGVRLMGAS